jgi:hypothetical protein
MDSVKAVGAVRELVKALAWSIALWHRGGSGKKAGTAVETALVNLFEAMTGRKPTPGGTSPDGRTASVGGVAPAGLILTCQTVDGLPGTLGGGCLVAGQAGQG